jgi:hypothetical protein
MREMFFCRETKPGDDRLFVRRQSLVRNLFDLLEQVQDSSFVAIQNSIVTPQYTAGKVTLDMPRL